MQQSPLGRSRKGKNWMEDCKQLILDLSAALNNKEEQNEQMLVKVRNLEHQIAGLVAKEQQMLANIASLQQHSSEQNEANARVQDQLRRQNQQLKFKLQSQTTDLQSIRLLNQELHSRLEAKEQEVTELSNSAKTAKNNISQAHSHISFLKNELEKFRQKMNIQERQHEEELEKLRDINASIKKQFDLMNAEYIEALNNYEVQTYRPPLGTKERARTSLPKKIRGTETNSNHKTSDSWHKFSGNNLPNPEMSQQLIRIKHEIANQYCRFSESRESVMKQRVSQTLTNIDSLLGEMECRIQEDSSSI